MNKLTKKELQNLEVGEMIVEKLFDETYIWEVEEVIKKDNANSVYQLVESNSRKRTKLTVGENFNKEGDRRYKSSRGSVIVNYFNHE